MIGKGGATLRKIREDTDTKVDLPGESSESDIIVITGRKENVQKARARILDIEKEMVSGCDFKYSDYKCKLMNSGVCHSSTVL